jgi:soluble lytic murein transglycosylase
MSTNFPEALPADRLTRAEMLYQDGRWADAEKAYDHLLDSIIGADRDRAELRIAECLAKRTRNIGSLETIQLTEPQLDAERWTTLAEAYRARKDEDRMLAAVEQAAQLDPTGPWATQALFLAGNYFWADLNRDRAVELYRRLAERSSSGQEVDNADWRIAWTAYLENNPDAAALLVRHVDRFPNSPYVQDALYWLGRLAEKAGDLPAARAYYSKVSERFVQTYFGQSARARLERIGTAPLPQTPIPLLANIPPLPPASSFTGDVPPAALDAYNRAEALLGIAFDDSAFEEFRAGYHATGAAELLVDAARAAQAGNHYLTGAALVRQVVPNLEERPMDEVPAGVWRVVYPFPLEPLIRTGAARYQLDPMLFAALIRQESGFQPNAVSVAGAVGLAQLEPRTARKWCRKLRLRYSLRRLTDPSYNLRLGGAYLQELLQDFASPEAALAAYNAGEDRVAEWRANTHFEDTPEFVESIPFTQTHHYVEVILAGAAIYRRLYQAQP